MRKGIRLVKRVMTLFLVLIFTVESFAAVVSDNDGSAFITKAEFDSLKNDFQTQIDQYNTSIDSKIDGAIASYLAGIKVAQEPTNYFTILKANLGEVRFLNSLKTTNATITTERNLTVQRHTYQKRYSGINYVNTAYIDFAMRKPNGSYCYTWIVALCRAGTESSFTDQNAGTFICDINAGTWDASSNTPDGWTNQTWERINMDAAWTVWGTQVPTSTYNYPYNVENTVTTAGSGQVYRYKVTPSGRKVLLSYCSTYYPVINLRVMAHTYKNYTGSYATLKNNYLTGSNLQYDNTSLSKSLTSAQTCKWGTLNSDAPFPQNYSSTSTEYRWSGTTYLVTVTDGINYETRIWGQTPTSNMYCIQDIAGLTAGSQITQAASTTQSTIPADNYKRASGRQSTDVTLSGVEVKYYSPQQSAQTMRITDFCNDYVSTVVGEDVKHGQGIKIGEIPQDGKVRVQMQFKNADSGNRSVTYTLTDGKVGATGTKVLKALTTVSCNNTKTVTDTVTFEKKGELWMNCYSATSGYDVILNSVNLRME